LLMKFSIIISLLACLANAAAGTSTLFWSAQDTGSGLCLVNGTPLPVGTSVRLGYFDLAAPDLEPLFTEPTVLNTHFTVLASATIGSFESQTYVGSAALNAPGTVDPAAVGAFAASIIFTPAANQVALDGKRCYVWAMNGTTVASSTQHGIFSHATWILNSNYFGAVQWDLGQVSAADPRDVILGHRGPQLSTIVGGTALRLTNTAQLKIDVADTDKDGSPGLLEEAFAMDPSVADSEKMPRISASSGTPSLRFTRKSGGTLSADGAYTAAGLRYTMEASTDLRTWIICPNANLTASATPETATTESISLQLTPATLPLGCRFARVRVERVQ
jgi:hypothetical protein